MTPLLEVLVSTRVAADLAVAILLKGSGILLATWATATVVRRRSSAVRHRVWVVGFGTLLVSTLLGLALPEGWGSTHAPFRYPAETWLVGVEAITTVDPTGTSDPVQAGAMSDVASGRRGPGWPPIATLLLLTWWIGALVLAVGFVSDLVRAARLRSRARPVDPDGSLGLLWTRLLETSRAGSTVELQLCPGSGRLAATLGLFRPTVVIGPEVAELEESQLSSVLVHELAHIQRRDMWSSILVALLAPLFWPNPLFWIARREMALHREQACDDAVLGYGVAAPTYAGLLLQFALFGREPAAPGQVGIMEFSPTGRRIRAVLAQRDRAKPGNRLTMVIVGFAAVFTLSLAALPIIARTPGTGSTSGLIADLGHVNARVRERAAHTLGRREVGVAREAMESALDDRDSAVRLAAIAGLHQLGDPASLPAMRRVLDRPFGVQGGEHGFVLKLAILTLGRIDSPRAAEVLIDQLDRPTAPLRWLALETLHAMPANGQAARPWLERFQRSDPSERNRRLAEEALALIGD